MEFFNRSKGTASAGMASYRVLDRLHRRGIGLIREDMRVLYNRFLG